MRTYLKSRKALTTGLVCLACVGGSGLPLGKNGQSLMSAALADPLAILGARSPGARGEGALASAKPARLLPPGTVGPGAPAGPTERVLPTVRDRPLPGVFPGVPVGGLYPIVPGVGGIPGEGTGGIIPGGGGFPIGGPGGVGGGGGIIPGGGGVAPVPPVSMIPEPSVWGMMIFGAFAIGAMLRRRRRLASVARPA